MPARTSRPPTAKQLAYLARLAGSRGVGFARPASSQAASRQIAALKAMPASRAERRLEQDLVAKPPALGTLAAVAEHEIEGYGASARWRRGYL
jgi:hypothetical protein